MRLWTCMKNDYKQQYDDRWKITTPGLDPDILLNFHHQVRSDDIDDIQDPRYRMRRRTFFQPVNNVVCTWVCMGLDGSTCSECLPERTCHFEPTEHLPRTSAGAQTCVLGPGGLPVCHGAESTRKKTRGRKRKKCRRVKKKHIYIPGIIYVYIYIYIY